VSDESPDTQALDDEVTTTKWAATQRIHDWLHTMPGVPLSSCGAWADTCPDWNLAYTLAEAALELPRKERTIPSPNGPCFQCVTGHKPKKRLRWGRRRRVIADLQTEAYRAEVARLRFILRDVSLLVKDPALDHVDRCARIYDRVGETDEWRTIWPSTLTD
jgi:hypothetical protein